eukprot:scaffold53937_cov17-Tisochrysis_lutea.AAC.1
MIVGNTPQFIEELGDEGVFVVERSNRRLLQLTKARAFARKMVERALLNSELAIRAELRFRAASNTEVTYTIDLFYPADVEIEDVAEDVQNMR